MNLTLAILADNLINDINRKATDSGCEKFAKYPGNEENTCAYVEKNLAHKHGPRGHGVLAFHVSKQVNHNEVDHEQREQDVADRLHLRVAKNKSKGTVSKSRETLKYNRVIEDVWLFVIKYYTFRCLIGSILFKSNCLPYECK